MLRKYIGTRQFYRAVMALTLPIMIQNGITNFVSMLDNIMVGRIDTVQMTGVSIANQLVFVFNLCIFGAVSGAGILGAQYYGRGDHDGVRFTFRFKLLFTLLLTGGCIALFFFCGDSLISLYLQGEGSTADRAATLACARDYLRIILIGLIPYTAVQCYSSTLRESGQSLPPMMAGLVAVAVNLGLNTVLIFGYLGAPRLGAVGAAIATVASRFTELLVVAVWTRRHSRRNPFILGAYRSLYIPAPLVRQVFANGLPLMLNETMWAAGMAALNQCYSVRGLDVVSANTVAQTFFNVFAVSFQSIGAAIGILLGQLLGAGKCEEARASSRKMIAFSVAVSIAIGAVYAVAAIFIPQIYNTTDEVRLLATRLMQLSALVFPLDAFVNAAYFALRSGGKTLITILFDSCFVWCIQVPAAMLLSRCTAMPILPLYLICQMLCLIKCVLGFIFVRRGTWARTLVAE